MRSAKEEQGVYWQRSDDIGQTYLEIEQRRMTQPKRQSWNGLREEPSVMSLNSIEENTDSPRPLILFSQTPNKSLLSFCTKGSYTQHHGPVGHIILCCVGFSYAL